MAQISVGGGGGGVGGGLSSIGRSVPRAPAPKPKPPATVGGGLQTIARTVSPGVRPQPPSPGGDHQSSGPNYGGNQAAAYKQTAQYRQIVRQVFAAQPAQQKAAIISGLVRLSGGNPYNLPEYKAIRPQWEHIAIPEQLRIQSLIPKDLPAFIANPKSPSIFQEAGQFLAKGLGNYGGKGTAAQTGGAGVLAAPGVVPNQVADHPGDFLKNAVSDAYHLPGNTVQGLYKVGSDVAGLHFGNAFHDFLDPYAQFFAHPGETFFKRPLTSALMFAGPEAAVGRVAGGLARTGAIGERLARAAETAREPLRMPDVGGFKGAPIKERSYSRNAFTQGMQKANEARQRSRGLDPNIARRPTGHVRHIVNEMTAVRQMVGRTERGVTMKVLQHVAPAREVRNVVAHILQGVVRTPETAVHDLHAEIARLEPHAASGVRKPSVAMARKQVKDLKLALAHPELLPAAFKAAGDIRQHLNASDAYLVRLGLLNPDQAMRSKLMPYAMAHMGAHHDPGQGLMVGEHPLATQEILDHLKSNNVPDPAYVGHYPQKVAAHRFYSTYKMARGTLGQKRTGEAFRVGSYDHTYNGLVAQGARTAEAITKAGLHDRVISRFGVKRPDGRDFTPAEARNAAYAALHNADHTPKRNGVEYVPVARAAYNALDHVRDLQHPHELSERVNEAEIAALERSIRDVESRSDSKRNVVLVPKAAVDQFRAQFAPQGGVGREIGRFTQQFRRTVLPYSTHWMFQIGTEAGLRGLLGGVLDPRNLIAGRQLVKELEGTREGRAKLAEMVNAVFYNQHDTLSIHNDPNPVVAGAKAFPPSRALISMHNHYADFVGHSMTKFEHEFRVMGLGKLARQQVQEFTKAYQAGIKLQGRNVAMLAEQLKANPNLVAKFGRQIDDIFGKYNKFSPKVRGAIQSFVPFLPWYLNAAKFVLWNLPVHSPIASSLLASLRQTVNQDVADGKGKPLDSFAAEQLARLSPWGLLKYPTKTGESPVVTGIAGAVAEPFLPEVEGSLYNLTGSNPFGEGPLKGPNGDVKPHSAQAGISAAESLLESFLPAARMVRAAREGTSSSYGTSTIVNPQGKGDHLGAGVLNRIFNPLYSFEQAKKPYVPASSGGGGGGGWGGSSGGGGWGGSSYSSGGWG